MTLAVITALFVVRLRCWGWILGTVSLGGIIGVGITRRINMTALPQLVAAFHSLIGLAALLLAYVMFFFFKANEASHHAALFLEIGLEAIVGAITFTGSFVAFGKLQGIFKSNAFVLPFQSYINAITGVLLTFLLIYCCITENPLLFVVITILSLYLGAGLIFPIGGSDMPVVVSLLNSFSGWAAAATGFTIKSSVLTITGALVGSSGAILSYVMCQNMNRSLLKVLFGKKYNPAANSSPLSPSSPQFSTKSVRCGDAEEAAFILQNAMSVIVVPGYGLAASQAQRVLQDMVTMLKNLGIHVRYAIHPVAGRMPGHMNVLLAEADVPYDDVFEMDEINADFRETDVAFVIGANDTTNPAALKDPQSPLFGMPILDVEKAKTILFVKRSLGAGYAGVENELFHNPKTLMILGDAKKVCDGILRALA
jgi:NAD(P) transhydrogenase subunit beta